VNLLQLHLYGRNKDIKPKIMVVGGQDMLW